MVENQKSFIAERNGKTISSTVLLRKKGESEADFMLRMNRAGWKGLDNPENHFTADGMGYHCGSLSSCSKCKTSQKLPLAGAKQEANHEKEYISMLTRILECDGSYEDIQDHFRILYPDKAPAPSLVPSSVESNEANNTILPTNNITKTDENSSSKVNAPVDGVESGKSEE